MAQEIEMKLTVADSVDLGAVRGICSFLSGGEGRNTKMMARYFDTEDGALGASRLAYRTRKEGYRWVACLKGSGVSEGGLHQRMEIEREVESGEADLTVFGIPSASLHCRHSIISPRALSVKDNLHTSFSIFLGVPFSHLFAYNVIE